MFKKILSFGLCIVAPAVFAHELTSFDAIMNALSSGKQVSVVMHGKQCKVTNPNDFKFPPASAVIKVESALLTEDKIGFDAMKYARAIPNIAPNGLIQRVSFILEKNGHFNGEIASFDAVTNMKAANRKDITVDCELGQNVRFYQV